ncbi:DEAD/DEAH box helicase [Frankia sp. Cr2]|uniref:DEAD/DEAH box helicase n=1 Tax=Frankia sp. Cr2 TaxID=3073932 RepID=UPI002AD45A29|nr:DEAD/DEAH box helicase [Frankia sp. Cr2]
MAATATPTSGFADLGVREEIVEALRDQGIISPFPIQELTLPLALAGSDLIGQARTGTGKTLAFAIPLVQTVTNRSEGAAGRPQALVVVPTRELCVQVATDIGRAGARRGLRVLSVYGGRAYEPQLADLRSGVDIVVGTPGRLLDLARQNALVLTAVRMLVLDEADEMLDLGFLPDVERILAQIPDIRQTLLFSATMPGPVVSLARRFMRRPVHVTAERPDEGRTVPDIRQHVFRAHALDKIEVLARVLQAEGRGLAIVFVRTRRTADKVVDDLVRRGFAAAAVHGDIGQGQREQALRAFRAGKIDVLVATDVAARGIDIGGVTHVINYQCPEDENVYLHRVGRTGRAGGSGVAVTFVDWDDLSRWTLVNRALALSFDTPVETYSTSPHLFEDLEIPADARGVLPHASRTRAGLAAEEVEDLGETGRGARRRQRRTDDRVDATAVEQRADRPAGSRTARARRRTRGAGAAVATNGATNDATNNLTNDLTNMDLAGPDLVPPVPGLFLEPATVASTVVHRDDPDLDHHELDGLDLDDEDGIAANGQPGPRRRRRRRGGRGRSAGTQTADVALPGGLDDPIERQAESA